MQPPDAVGDEPSGLVLVVEDDRSTRELLAAILTEEALPFHLSSNGHEALEFARDHPPSMVVLDVHLPNLQGEAVATALKIEFGQGLPILAMSATDERRTSERWGAFGYLGKPFDVDDFVASVRQGLALSEQGRRLRLETNAARRRMEQSLARQRQLFDEARASDGSLPDSAALP